ncbi:hypothetical protein [Gordonia sp. OPL2]|uniref:hypothetical protein n=1 Tax=Gordonia sp. OPL2 TaxID=2486274 RepID=UPI0016556F93|nr:hypothetical protein [Gordonia sp. OPL2]
MATALVEGLTFTTSDPVIVDDALLGGFADVLGSRSDCFGLPLVFSVTTILAHLAMDSGAVPRDGLVHTAESLRVTREPRLGDRLTGELVVEEIRRRAGATQLQVRSTIFADDLDDRDSRAPIAVTVSTLTFRTPDDWT